MTSAQAALFATLIGHLDNASPLWEGRVWAAELVPADTDRPFVHYFRSAGGRNQSVPANDQETLTVVVKGVALDLQTAEAISWQISYRLHNAGEQDYKRDTEPFTITHPEWHILTVTEDNAVVVDEAFEGAQMLYHRGHQYVVLMERK